MDFKKTDIVMTTEMPEQNETSDECTNRRLSKRLSECEVACIETEGRAKQLRKERDLERTRNEKLRKDVEKLTNQLLRERMKVSCLENEVKILNKQTTDRTEDEDGYMKNADISENLNGQDTVVSFIDPNLHNNLTSKLMELKTAMEERMERQPISKSKQNDYEKFITLSMLIQSLQDYLRVDLESKQTCKQEAEDIVDSGLTNLRNEVHSKPKAQLSLWLKIMVYIGPIFLSILCYIAFNTGKH